MSTKSDYKISTSVNLDGSLEVLTQQKDESDTDIFQKHLKHLTSLLQKVTDLEIQNKVQNQILAATLELQTNPTDAISQLSKASMIAVMSIKKANAIEKRRKSKASERLIVLGLAAFMILVVSVLAFFLDDTSEIKVIGLPLPVVLWSFIGGVGATLYAFVGTQKHMQTEPIRIDWLIGRPIVGIIMGSVVYLVVATSVSAISGDIQVDASVPGQRPYLLWALAFIGGFSDKFAVMLFDNLVGKYTKGESDDDPKAPPPAVVIPVVQNPVQAPPPN